MNSQGVLTQGRPLDGPERTERTRDDRSPRNVGAVTPENVHFKAALGAACVRAVGTEELL